MFKMLKLRRRLKEIGSSIDTSYLLFINNEKPISFPTRSQVLDYVKRFREDNTIFNLQIYRIETYSL